MLAISNTARSIAVKMIFDKYVYENIVISSDICFVGKV